MKKQDTSAVVTEASPNKLFDREAFKKEILENVKMLYRKTIDMASKEEVFQAVALATKDIIVDEWLATHKKYNEENPRSCTICPWSSSLAVPLAIT